MSSRLRPDGHVRSPGLWWLTVKLFASFLFQAPLILLKVGPVGAWRALRQVLAVAVRMKRAEYRLAMRNEGSFGDGRFRIELYSFKGFSHAMAIVCCQWHSRPNRVHRFGFWLCDESPPFFPGEDTAKTMRLEFAPTCFAAGRKHIQALVVSEHLRARLVDHIDALFDQAKQMGGPRYIGGWPPTSWLRPARDTMKVFVVHGDEGPPLAVFAHSPAMAKELATSEGVGGYANLLANRHEASRVPHKVRAALEESMTPCVAGDEVQDWAMSLMP